MAAVLEERPELEESDHFEDDTERKIRVVFSWMFDYCCFVFWEEFKSNFTVDAKSNRRLLEAIPMYAVESSPSRNRLAHFVMLLTRLADGPDFNTEYSGADESGTPLEGALVMFDTLMGMMEENEEEFEDRNSMKTDIKAQAVLVCCRGDAYDIAVDVFDRLWVGKDLSASEQKVKEKLDIVLQTESLRTLPRDMSWKSFQKRAISFLEQIYGQMDVPFLYQASEKFYSMKRKKQAANVRGRQRRKLSGASSESEHTTDSELEEDTSPRKLRSHAQARQKSSASSGIEENICSTRKPNCQAAIKKTASASEKFDSTKRKKQAATARGRQRKKLSGTSSEGEPTTDSELEEDTSPRKLRSHAQARQKSSASSGIEENICSTRKPNCQAAIKKTASASEKIDTIKRKKQTAAGKGRQRKKMSGASSESEHTADSELVEDASPRRLRSHDQAGQKSSASSGGIEENEDGEDVQGEGEVGDSNNTSYRVMPYRVLLAVGREFGQADFDNGQWNEDDVMTELTNAIAKSTGRKTRQESPQVPMSKQASSSSKQAVSPSRQTVSPSKQAVSPSKQAVSPSKQAHSQVSSQSKQASSPSKEAISPSKPVIPPSKQARSQVSSQSNQASSRSKQAISPPKQAASPSKQVVSPSKQAALPSKQVVSPSNQACSQSKQVSSSSSKQASSPFRSRKTRSGKTMVVQFTPRKRPRTRSDDSDESSEPVRTYPRRSSKSPVSPIVVDDDDDDEEEEEEDNGDEQTQDISGNGLVTSTPHPNDVRDKPSTSTAAKSARETDVHNKENNSPKRGRCIRDQRYQPGRVTIGNRHARNRNANSNTNYTDWSSDEESDSPEDIFDADLQPRKVRRSLALESFQVAHKMKRPAQRVPWTAEEEEKLRQGVAKYGKGNWAKIRDKCSFVMRTSVNLKDKWRNIEKAGGGLEVHGK